MTSLSGGEAEKQSVAKAVVSASMTAGHRRLDHLRMEDSNFIRVETRAYLSGLAIIWFRRNPLELARHLEQGVIDT